MATPKSAAPTAVAPAEPPRTPPADFQQLLATPLTEADERAGCLLARVGEGWFLASQPVLATREQPDLPHTLASGEATSRARVLTRFGPIGRATEGPILVSATRMPASRVHAPAMVVFVPPEGPLPVRFTDRAGQEIAGAHAFGLLADEAHRIGIGSLWLSPASTTPTARLHELLAGVPAGMLVGLAIALPANTTLPAQAAQPNISAHCPEGLSEPAPERAAGALGPDAIVAALGPLKHGAQHCLGGAIGLAAAGGRVALAMRISEQGGVEEACLVQDAIGDPTMAACLVEYTRTLRFPGPSPKGFVDVQVPLLLTPKSETPPQPLCE